LEVLDIWSQENLGDVNGCRVAKGELLISTVGWVVVAEVVYPEQQDGLQNWEGVCVCRQ